MEKKIKIFSNHCGCGIGSLLTRSISTNLDREPNPYKVLGLRPSATQAEIKSAYYELSKLHHPDKNKGCQISAKKFKDITAAYDTLKNEKLRSKYNREFSTKQNRDSSTNYGRSYAKASAADYNDDAERVYYERITRVRRRKFYGRTKIYDFDAWYRAHYANPNVYKYKTHTEYQYQNPFSHTIVENSRIKTYIFVTGLFMMCMWSALHR